MYLRWCWDVQYNSVFCNCKFAQTSVLHRFIFFHRFYQIRFPSIRTPIKLFSFRPTFFNFFCVLLPHLVVPFKILILWLRVIINICSMHAIFKFCGLFQWGYVLRVYSWRECCETDCRVHLFWDKCLLPWPECHPSDDTLSWFYSRYTLSHECMTVFDESLWRGNQICISYNSSLVQVSFTHRRFDHLLN